MEKLAVMKFWYEKIVNMNQFLDSDSEEKKACFGGLSMYAKRLLLQGSEDILDAYLKDFYSPDSKTEDNSTAMSKNYQLFVLGFGYYMATKTPEQLHALAIHGEKLHHIMLKPLGTECLTSAFHFPEKVIHLLTAFSIRTQAAGDKDEETVFDDLDFLPQALRARYYRKGLTCAENY